MASAGGPGPIRRSASRASTSRADGPDYNKAKMRLTKFNPEKGREASDEVIELGALQLEHLPYAALVAVDFSGMEPGTRKAMKVGAR